MKIYRLKDFIRGWVVGDFKESIIRTKAFEFAVKNYRKGDKEKKHVHKKADEVSVVISGKFRMNGKILNSGSVIWLKPGQPANFSCLKSGSTAVIKTPSVIGDKYLI